MITTLAVMSPTGGIALLAVVLVALGMIVAALMRGTARRNYAPTDEKDLVRRIHVTLPVDKAMELAADLGKCKEALAAKKATDYTPERATCYMSDGDGSFILDMQVVKK